MITVKTIGSYRENPHRCRSFTYSINRMCSSQDVINLCFGIVLLIRVHGTSRSKESVNRNQVTITSQLQGLKGRTICSNLLRMFGDTSGCSYPAGFPI